MRNRTGGYNLSVRKTSVIAFAAFATFAAHAQKKPVTIDAISTEHKVTGFAPVQWAPDSRRFAWLEDKELWLYDVPSGRRKLLLNLADLEARAVKPPPSQVHEWRDVNVAEQVFSWSDSGNEMLITAAADLFLLHVDSGKWDQLTATAEVERDAKLSPGGRYAAFRREHDLYSLEIASGKVVRLTHDGSAELLNGELDWVYPEELEIGTAYWWSPDGLSIAFLQLDVSREPMFPQVDALSRHARFEPERYPLAGQPNAEARIGVVPAVGGETRWMDLGEPRDNLLARVVWLPDSRAVAVEKLNRIQNRLDLFVAGAANGSARIVLHEEDPYWININNDLRFFKDGSRFLWGSERDGFHHLYLYSTGGKLLRQLTEGDWEVDSVAGVDESAGSVYFTSTEASPLERQLYSVDLEGKHRRRISRESGTHDVSFSPDSRMYLDTASSLASPPRRSIHRIDGSETAVFREADHTLTDEYEILPTEIHKVTAADGSLLYARLIKPAGFKPDKKYPAIVVVYGGPHVQTVLDKWPLEGWLDAAWDQVMAHRGFVIWQLDNRGSWGRGHRWESVIFRDMGEHELEDQRRGFEYLKSLGFVDTEHMGIFGWSYGGYMTLYTLAHAPGVFRAGIAGAPVTHWRNYDTIYTERYMGLPAENAAAYDRASALTYAADLKDNLLLVHNLEDDNVHFQNTVQMIDALERAGKLFSVMVYTQKTHHVSPPERRQLYETLTEFFEKNVK